MNKLKSFVLSSAILLANVVFSQKTIVYTHQDVEFKKAVELFQKEKYGAAQKSFFEIVKSHADAQSLVRIDAEYYYAICAIELFNKDGELYLKQFIKDHPESPKAKAAYFYLGKYNYRKKKYKDAIEWFEKVDIYELTTEELAEFYFKRGYSFFETKKTVESKKDLYEIKDVDNKYAAPAKYYYAHMAYDEKNYETALTDFLKLQQNETFGSIVPYYITQIYFLQGKYESVISYAPNLLDSAVTKRVPEIARVLGEAYYRTEKYKQAIPYLRRYEKAVKNLPRKDNYQMGFAYYKEKDYEEAIDYFVKVGNIDDSLEQSAYYHIADCYLKMNNKQNALNAFGQAARFNFNKSIQEDALFNYAKLCYELAFNPYNQAIKAFQKYINDFPDAIHADEAYAYLVNMFITTKSYKEALDAIENIKVLTPELKQIHQKIAFYRGVDLFNNMQYKDAIKLFDKSMTYTFDKNVRASAIYWKAEAHYRLNDYQKAIDNYQAYIAEPGAIGKSELSDANYNVGYCYYKLKDYTNSVLWFRKFVTFKPQAEAKKINDAYNRIGDGYFMANDFSNAVDYYEQSYKMKMIDVDYALFQKALASGVQKKYDAKINDLKVFISNYPKSIYIQKAKFELAQTYYTNNQNDLALTQFKNFIEEYPNSAYINTSLSKIALIYYAKKEDDIALDYFDKLIKRDRKSAEANEALNTVKAIYMAKGNVDEMEKYLSSVGAAIPQGALDSIAYGIGKNHYMEQDCKNTVLDFEKYIQKFSDGIFMLPANFYKAECDYKLGNIDAAIVSYKAVASKPKNEFTEQALYRLSDMLYKKQDYAGAITYYAQLEQQAENSKNNATAKIGLMRCNYQVKNYSSAIEYANKVVALDKSSNELIDEAHFTIAQSQMATEKYDDALATFQSVVNTSKSELAAESYYQIASILFQKKDFKQSQKSIFDLLNSDGDYPYWVTKAMILLADNYVALNDNFQAKATLNGVIGESNIPELIKIAQEKLNKIIADEEAAKQIKQAESPLKIEFEGNSVEQNKLFTEPVVVPPVTAEPKHE